MKNFCREIFVSVEFGLALRPRLCVTIAEHERVYNAADGDVGVLKMLVLAVGRRQDVCIRAIEQRSHFIENSLLHCIFALKHKSGSLHFVVVFTHTEAKIAENTQRPSPLLVPQRVLRKEDAADRLRQRTRLACESQQPQTLDTSSKRVAVFYKMYCCKK